MCILQHLRRPILQVNQLVTQVLLPRATLPVCHLDILQRIHQVCHLVLLLARLRVYQQRNLPAVPPPPLQVCHLVLPPVSLPVYLLAVRHPIRQRARAGCHLHNHLVIQVVRRRRNQQVIHPFFHLGNHLDNHLQCHQDHLHYDQLVYPAVSHRYSQLGIRHIDRQECRQVDLQVNLAVLHQASRVQSQRSGPVASQPLSLPALQVVNRVVSRQGNQAVSQHSTRLVNLVLNPAPTPAANRARIQPGSLLLNPQINRQVIRQLDLRYSP